MHANYQILRSAAGFRIGLAQLPESECAAVSIHIPVGSRDDPPGLAGLAHFVEHMIFKGTATRDARQISIETEDAGATLNAATSEDQTSYEAHGDTATLPLLVDVLCDMVWHSSFPEQEITLERDVIAEEIVMYQEAPSDHISDLISSALWSPHPLGEPISGSLESIRPIKRDTLTQFTARHHHRNDIVISVAGPFTPAQVLELFEPRLPKHSTAAQDTQPYLAPAEIRPPQIDCRETQQLQLALAFATFGRHDPRRHALRLLAMILGEGASSRLFLKLREERGLCYQIACDTTLLADTGSLEIHAGLDPSSRDEALLCIRAELADLADHGPTNTELARVKRLTASATRSAMESTAAHACWVGECILQHNSIQNPSTALEKIEAVTAAEIQDIAGEVFSPTNEAFAEIRPITP